MFSSVRSRPNFYESLGLTPSASEAQINEAFVKKVSQSLPSDTAAQMCIAYETLRNPVKRRDYDLSLGLGAKPKLQPTQLTIAVSQQRWAPFIASPSSETAAPQPQRRDSTRVNDGNHHRPVLKHDERPAHWDQHAGERLSRAETDERVREVRILAPLNHPEPR